MFRAGVLGLSFGGFRFAGERVEGLRVEEFRAQGLGKRVES